MGTTSNWRDVDGDPNARANILARDAVLQRAFVAEHRSREEIIVGLCRGAKVLDVGCVDHQAGNVGTDRWLHGLIATAASECLGVDLDQPGVDAMQHAGFDAMCVDITADRAALFERGPFDVVVAGEVIEHLGNPEALLRAAGELLRPGGKLVVTTPNPFAPWRAWAGMRRQTWENVDHVLLLFPSGMAELAERCGLTLTTATTVGGYRLFMRFPGAFRVLAGMWARALLRRPDGDPGPWGVAAPAGYVNPVVAYVIHRLAPLGQLNETALYVLERE